MSSYRKGLARKAALAASALVLAVALPTSVFAVGLLGDEASPLGRFSFTPASADPEVAELVADRAGSQAGLMRFTPAGAAAARTERSLTVAVRVDGGAPSVLGARNAPAEAAGAGLRLAPTRYNLGIARGYGSFAQSPAFAQAPLAPAAPGAAPSRSTTLSRSLSDANIPDLAAFTPRAGVREDPSRFAARVRLDEERPAAASPARASVRDQMVDLGGSYSLTRNLDITAGVRYEQDRDIVPLPDVDQQDSQAVYIGTQFRF